VKEIQPPLEGVRYTDFLVGPFGITPGCEENQSLEAWQLPFHEVALGALKRVADVGQRAPLPEDWQPAPADGAALYRDLAYERKLHGMIGGLKSYVADKPEGSAISKFRDNQHEMAEALAEAFEGVRFGEPIRVKSPTGSGKTAVIVGLTEGLKHKEQPNDEAGVLILVPRKDILAQTITAFERFSDTIWPSIYFGEQKNLSKVTVMTYQSFNKAYEAGLLTKNMFNAVIRDESHRAGGKTISKNLHDFCYGSDDEKHMAVFDLSATPRVDEETLVYSKSVVSGIGEGLLAPVSARRIFTGAQIIERAERFAFQTDFTEGEVGSLIHNQARNEVIVDEILSGLRGGRRTIVRCLPGDNLAHPEIIKSMLDARGKVKIVNPYMEDYERRKPNVVIIRGDMPINTRKKLYKVFSEDMNFDLDVLLFVETMTEGWDGPIAKKLINASPTRAGWLMEQLFGRVLRPYTRHSGELVTAEAVDLIDRSDSGQVSFTDILTRDGPEGMRYREGATVGKDLADLSDPLRRKHGAYELAA